MSVKFTIAPLGSCRIATPLRIARDNFGFRIEKSRVYGFCHSSAEAVQMSKIMTGEISPPRDIWPFIARDTEYDQLLSQPFRRADAYVVEISSSKQVSIGGWYVQLNYLVGAFRDYFSSTARARDFWRLAAAGDQEAIDANLAGWKDHEDVAVLRQVRQSLTTPAELERDMQTLIDTFGDVLFITHVNARTPSGDRIASRSSLIADVVAAGHKLGAAVFNPTAAMERKGQELAIADHSDSLAHFTDEFASEVTRYWFDLKLFDVFDQKVISGGEATLTGAWTTHFEALVQQAEHEGVDRRLACLGRDCAKMPGIPHLQYKLALSCHEPEAALTYLGQAIELDPSDKTMQRKYCDLARDLGQMDKVLTLFTGGKSGLGPADLNADELSELAAIVLQQKGLELAADLVADWRISRGTGNLANHKLRELFDAQINAQTPDTDTEQHIKVINAVLHAMPRHSGARLALRGLRRTLLTKARQHFKAGDIDALDALDAKCAGLSEPIKEFALFRARLLFESGGFEDAIVAGRVASRHLPDNISVRALLMRAAVKTKDWLEVEDQARAIVALSDAETDRLETEARKNLERNPVICAAQALKESDPIRLLRLLSIARRDPKAMSEIEVRYRSAQEGVVAEIHQLQIRSDARFPARYQEAFAAMGADPRLLQAAGRYYLKDHDFSTAATYWKSLAEVDPENSEASAQLARCEDHLSASLVEGAH